MIRNRLASLLADRGIKISRAAMELPNISRNTITNTASNKGKMIQLETIDTLCQYLDITPAEFFEYLPYDLIYHTDITKNEATTDELFDFINLKANDITFDFYIKKVSHNGKPNKLFGFSGNLDYFQSNANGTKLFLFLKSDDDNHFKELWNDKKISGFRSQIWKELKSNIATAINESMIERFPQAEDEPFNYIGNIDKQLYLETDFHIDPEYISDDDRLPF